MPHNVLPLQKFAEVHLALLEKFKRVRRQFKKMKEKKKKNKEKLKFLKISLADVW